MLTSRFFPRQTHPIPKRTFHSCSLNITKPKNEPVFEYRKGSKERNELEHQIAQMKKKNFEIPLIINGKEIKTGNVEKIRVPHNHQQVLGVFHKASAKEVQSAIEGSLQAKKHWNSLPFESRASVFLKAADLAATKYRQLLNASTVLGQSKNYFQAEVDAACELVDFLRFNVYFATQIHQIQPESTPGCLNRSYYRPLDGFVYAISPFNFTAIGCNLAASPATMGNVVVWKPSDYAILSNYYVMKLYQEAGLPDGVINFVPGDPVVSTEAVLQHPEFSGLHFTGSSAIFQSLFAKVSNNLANYKSFPRIVGETGGKNFLFAHHSAEARPLAVALVRGAFEYAGQKCSATSRAYIPKSLWPKVKEELLQVMKEVTMGNPEDPSVLVNAVIHKGAFDRAKSYIDFAKSSQECQVLVGGKCDDSVGYFIEPTIVLTTNPKNKLMVEEIFAPIIAVYVYDDAKVEETLQLCDQTTKYALTGCIWSQDLDFLNFARKELEFSTGNLYLNDKSTGSVVNQQPFGGSRMSGTNDKAGSMLNLLRWTSGLAVKETFNPPTQVLYPYMTDK